MELLPAWCPLGAECMFGRDQHTEMLVHARCVLATPTKRWKSLWPRDPNPLKAMGSLYYAPGRQAHHRNRTGCSTLWNAPYVPLHATPRYAREAWKRGVVGEFYEPLHLMREHVHGLRKHVASSAAMTVYLGFWYLHHGHFLVETLARCWALTVHAPTRPQGVSEQEIVFHPMGAPVSDTLPPAHAFEQSVIWTAFARLFNVSRVSFIHHPTLFEDIYVPSELSLLHRLTYPSQLVVYHHIVQAAFQFALPMPTPSPSCVYVSRRFESGRTHGMHANEGQVEAFYAARGFHVLQYAAMLPLATQARLFGGVSCLAGYEGSGLHNSVFMLSPHALVIEMDDAGVFNVQQRLLARAARQHVHRVPLPSGMLKVSELQWRLTVGLQPVEPALKAACEPAAAKRTTTWVWDWGQPGQGVWKRPKQVLSG
jgi:hypothetical protein